VLTHEGPSTDVPSATLKGGRIQTGGASSYVLEVPHEGVVRITTKIAAGPPPEPGADVDPPIRYGSYDDDRDDDDDRDRDRRDDDRDR